MSVEVRHRAMVLAAQASRDPNSVIKIAEKYYQYIQTGSISDVALPRKEDVRRPVKKQSKKTEKFTL